LQADVWIGPAVDLASRNEIAVYPVAGWWKNRPALRRYDRRARYGLVVSLSTADQTVDLYSEIQQRVELSAPPIEVRI
jgi:hypothetical protein